jgi:hypothetical protein
MDYREYQRTTDQQAQEIREKQKDCYMYETGTGQQAAQFHVCSLLLLLLLLIN